MLAMLAMLVKARAGLVVFVLFWFVMAKTHIAHICIYSKKRAKCTLVPIINVKLCSAICDCD
jgi:hypothetical protein